MLIHRPANIYRISLWSSCKNSEMSKRLPWNLSLRAVSPVHLFVRSYIRNTFHTFIRTSYLSSEEAIPHHLSPLCPLTCSVPQGSVLGQFFTLYTTPLSSVISSSNISRQLHAEGTHLFTLQNFISRL